MTQIKVLTVTGYKGFVSKRFLDTDTHDVVILLDEDGRLFVLLTMEMYRLLIEYIGSVILDRATRVGCFIHRSALELCLDGYDIIKEEIETIQ